jgi:hypothetical protein
MNNGIHWRDGLFFERTDAAHVKISGKDAAGNSWSVSIPPNEWASIIHHVRWQPVDHSRWSPIGEAEDFHSGVRHA